MILENQLKQPPRLSAMKITDYLEWIKLYKLVNDWVLVDFDFAMDGNKLVYNQLKNDILVAE